MLVEISSDGHIGRVTLNQPEKKNPLSADVLEHVLDGLDQLRSEGARAAVISGAANTFCSGYTLQTAGSGAQARPPSTVDDLRRLRRLGELPLAIRRHPMVTIAEIRGYCVAGGTDLMLVSDIAIAAKSAQIGLPNVRSLGISLLSPFWPLVTGPMRAKMMMFTGDLISGADAETWGLVALAVADEKLAEIVGRLARRISLTPEEMLASVKSASNRAFELIGTESMVAAAVELDALAHASEPTNAFWRAAQADGVKATLAARDAPYAGDGLAEILADCAGGGRDAAGLAR